MSGVRGGLGGAFTCPPAHWAQRNLTIVLRKRRAGSFLWRAGSRGRRHSWVVPPLRNPTLGSNELVKVSGQKCTITSDRPSGILLGKHRATCCYGALNPLPSHSSSFHPKLSPVSEIPCHSVDNSQVNSHNSILIFQMGKCKIKPELLQNAQWGEVCWNIIITNPILGTVSPILSTIDSVSSSLHSFTLLLTWDEKLRTCFEIATKVKRPEQVQLRSNPVPGEWATVIGSKFGEIITTCVTLLDGGDSVGPPSNTSHHVHHPLPSTPENVHQAEGAEGEAAAQGNPAKFRFGIQAEEELLSDEAQLLFRLDATLTYFMSWVMKRSKSWLNSWAVPQFLASSQRDTQLLWQLLKSREVRSPFVPLLVGAIGVNDLYLTFLLQSILVTRQIFLSSESTSVRLSAKQRQLCADDLRDSFNLLHVISPTLAFGLV